jgi:hypothetical protein
VTQSQTTPTNLMAPIQYRAEGLSARWSVEELTVCFVVKDETGRKLAFVYFEDDPERRSQAKLLARDEAHRIAVNMVELSDLLRKP